MPRDFDVVAFPTHRYPHPDEFLTRYLLEKLAEGVFGDKSALTIAPDAQFVIWGGEGHLTPDCRPVSDWIDEGYLPLGIGGPDAPYDDHTKDDRIKVSYCKECVQRGEFRWCSSDKVAFEYGIAADPRVRRLLEYVHRNDCHGHGAPFDFGRTLAAEQRENGRHPEEVYRDFRRLVLEPEFNQQQQLFGPAKAAFEACATIVPFTVIRGKGEKKERRLVVLDAFENPLADTPRAAEYAKMEDRPKPAHHIVVYRDGRGHIQVMLNRDADFNMSASAAVLRYLEWKARGSEGPVPTYDEMAVADNCSRVPCWHFQSETGHIFNGNHTHPDVEPSKLDLATVVPVLTQLTIPQNKIVREYWENIDRMIDQVLTPKASPVEQLADSGVLRQHKPHRRETVADQIEAPKAS